MSYVIFVIISMSFVFSACNGTMNDLSVAALTSCKDAVTLCISLCGTICLWSGIMNVAGKSGIVSGLSRLLSKPLSLLFPDISSKGSAMQYIILNFISNLLGLGNAIGSNLFNILFILGFSAILSPLHVLNESIIDCGILLISSILLFIFAKTKQHMSKLEGIVCIGLYLAYMGYLLI